MGRGKSSRRRASLDGPVPVPNGYGGPSSGSSSRVDSHLPALATRNSTSPSNSDEVFDTIEFQWKKGMGLDLENSLDLRSFLLSNTQELSLRNFVDYWTNPVRAENVHPNIAASMCYCSWYLALNYMSIGMVAEAKALTLNGCFMQQCYNKPIKEIASIAQSTSGEHHAFDRERLPFFADGLLAVSSKERTAAFLRNKVSNDYQRRMSFAEQTPKSKKKVQDYMNQISWDWNNGRVNSAAAARRRNEARRRASLDSIPADSFVVIKLVDSRSGDERTMRHGLSMPLKTLFKKYAEDRNLSLRQLRFSYQGRTLFLSSVGGKTPENLGMRNLDSIYVINNAEPQQGERQQQRREQEEETSGSSSSDESKKNMIPSRGGSSHKGKHGKHHRQCRRASWSGPEIMEEGERLKLTHSHKLSKVFTEVAPQFEQIRQRLNALNLACAPPKVKVPRKKVLDPEQSLPLNNPGNEGVGGKAGVPFHVVHVGVPENLYNTKNTGLSSLNRQKPISVDLHGLTREQALSDLNARLPGLVNLAMRGSQPFVIRVVIICGGGSQVLSEAVESWIRGNKNVARAPKRFSRRRSI